MTSVVNVKWNIVQEDNSVDAYHLTLDDADGCGGGGAVEDRVVGEEQHQQEQQTDQHHCKKKQLYSYRCSNLKKQRTNI